MSIRSSQLELTGHLICLSLDISSLSDYGARASQTDSSMIPTKGFASTKGFRFFHIIFQLFPFSKTFKQPNGCHAHKIFIMDDEGRKLVKLHCSSTESSRTLKSIFEKYWHLKHRRKWVEGYQL